MSGEYRKNLEKNLKEKFYFLDLSEKVHGRGPDHKLRTETLLFHIAYGLADIADELKALREDGKE